MRSGSFSNPSCIYLSTVLEESDTAKSKLYVSIYEICYRSEYQAKKLINAVEKYQVTTLDWIDASIPVFFYHRGLSVFIFIDFSDDQDDARFKRISDKVIQNLRE
jgi:hypothetical protein